MSIMIEQFANRFLSGYGIAFCTIDTCIEKINEGSKVDKAALRVVDATSDTATALEFLSILSIPASRHVAFAVGSKTAFVNNYRVGSDYVDQVGWFAKKLNSHFARIVNREDRIWVNGTVQEVTQFAARIFELIAPSGDCVRRVTCINDGGRWKFSESGKRHSIEDNFPYDARKIRDRFGTAELEKLAIAFGIAPLEQSSLLGADRYYLLSSGQPAQNTCTIAEADDPAFGYYTRGLAWIP